LDQQAAEVVAVLGRRGLTIATAEATTGGLIGHLLTGVPGSSAVFRAGVAPYSNAAKRSLGVLAATLERAGAVSQETAEALAVAVRSWAGADIGLAETGIAGPGGGAEGRPVGLFWIAVALDGGVVSERRLFERDRSGNRLACAEAALRMVLDSLPG
jgi:nicotinamide-nucleotide amidase